MKFNIVAHTGSGGNHGQKSLDNITGYLDKINADYSVYISKYKSHTVELIKNIHNEDAKLIIIGGDGTLNESINALKEVNSTQPIAYFPSGTGNDFCREIGITTDAKNFIDDLIELNIPTELEIIKYENLNNKSIHYAVNSVGFGIDALVIYLSSISSSKSFFKKIGLGKLTYLSYIFGALKKHKNYNISLSDINGNNYEFKDSMLTLITNHPYFGGGIKIDPLSKSNNGELGVVVTENIRMIDFIKIITRVLSKGDHFEKYEKIKRLSTKKITLSTDTLQYMQADGEMNEPQKYNIEFSLSSYPFWICK